MLSESDRHSLVGAGIGFLQTVSGIYGAEKGMELWATIADTIDPELKGAVFMAMLSGNFRQDKIFIQQTFLGSSSTKIDFIKCLRTYDRRRLSLKEAKDIADRLEQGHQEGLEVEPNLKPTFVVELRKLNMVVL